MKKIIAAMLCVMMVVCSFGAHAYERTGFTDTVDMYLLYHSAYFTGVSGFTYGVEYPLQRIGIFDDTFEVYGLENNDTSFLFLPDATGEGIEAVFIIAQCGDFEADFSDSCYLMSIEIIGLLNFFIEELMVLYPNFEISDEITGRIAAVYYDVVYNGAESTTSTDLRIDGVAAIQFFAADGSIGAVISFDTPITSDILETRSYLLEYATGN